MKVLQINSVCGTGSTGRIATDIHHILMEQGHESYIAYGRRKTRDCENSVKIGGVLDNYIHVAKTRFIDRHGFGSKNATIDFIKKVDKVNPDLIHLHNMHGYYLNIDVLFKYLKEIDKPVIWTLHDCWAFTGHCSHFDYIGCKKWKTGCSECPQKRQYPSSLFIDNSRINYSHKKELFTGFKNMTIITPSKWLNDLVNESFLKEYRLRIINNGIDLQVFKPTISNFRENLGIQNKFLILGVANVWSENKGYNYFIDLSKKLKNDEIIVLVGVTEKQRKTLPNNIIGIRKTYNINELVEIYSSSDIYVNLTLEDTFPTTNLEAIACGTPVITFNTGGSVESVNYDCGFVIEKGNINDLINKINLVKKAGKDSFENSLRRASKKYDKNQRFNEYIEIYKESISMGWSN